MKKLPLIVLAVTLLTALPARASFHLMQIEQVAVDVNGDPTAQAIQLRMRAPFENMVQSTRIVVVDAAGENPVEVIDIASSVLNGETGDRVLIASSSFESECGSLPADFAPANLIPESYFAAGSLTFETDLGTILWRLCWGGAAYTGPTTGALTNDPDGEFGPPFMGPLPDGDTDALQFQGPAEQASTNSLTDYLVVDPSTWTNNARVSCSLGSDVAVPGVTIVSGSLLFLDRPRPNPFRAGTSVRFDLPHEARVTVGIYDVTGRLVQELVGEETRPSGSHTVDWDGRDVSGAAVAAGVYLFRLSAGEETRTVKGVLKR